MDLSQRYYPRTYQILWSIRVLFPPPDFSCLLTGPLYWPNYQTGHLIYPYYRYVHLITAPVAVAGWIGGAQFDSNGVMLFILFAQKYSTEQENLIK